MKKIFWIIAFATLLILIFAIWSWQEKDASPRLIEPDAESEARDEEIDQTMDEIDPEMDELRKTLTAEQIEYIEYQHKAALAANQNVVFYGKCVDQDGNPIPGVLVEARLTKIRKSVSSVVAKESFKNYETLQATSDENGRFEFIDEGSYLLLESIQKEGYMNGRGSVRRYRFGQILYGNTMAGMHEPAPLNPVVFNMWKKGDGSETMLTKIPRDGVVGPELNIEKEATGRPHYFDFRRGRESGEPSSDAVRIVGESEGDAHWDPVELKNVVSKNHFSWSFQMSMPGGGLQETNDPFLFRPPESGYSENYELSVSDDPEEWKGDVFGKKFYLKTSDGNYGAFVLDVRASPQGNIRFFFNEVFFNPSGERDLEYLQ